MPNRHRSTVARSTCPKVPFGVALVLLLVAILLALTLVPAAFAETTPTSGNAQDNGNGADGSEDAGDEPATLDVSSPVRFVSDESIIRVDGAGQFVDTIELSDVLVNELSMEAYLAGVAEMPSRWSFEALKAQAVAARTYAWFAIEVEAYDNYDICASTACQVFRGAGVMLEGGDEWGQAVLETAGEVLVEEPGTPILARYFSTSGGQTYANDEVFSNGPRDYLVSIEDPYDEVSPYHRWTVEFSREVFDDLLSRGETLSAAVPVAEVERLGDVREQHADLRVTGTDGTEVDVGAAALRDFLSNVASERYPDLYPSAREDGLRPLPSTIPSTRFNVEVADDTVTVQGQGWGHGVGMGQYGARGRANDGQSYEQILQAYYNGLEPVVDDALPSRIRVGMDLPESVLVEVHGDVRIVDGDDEVVLEADAGAWQAEPTDDGWRLVAQNLDVEPTESPFDDDPHEESVETTAFTLTPLWLVAGVIAVSMGLLLFVMAVVRKGRT